MSPDKPEPYHHILLATDLSPYAELVAQRALDLLGQYQARLSVLHVVEELILYDEFYDPIIPVELDLETQLTERAKEQLDRMLDGLGARTAQRAVVTGTPKAQITDYARENGVDLIVMGSHGRHGIDRLLGSVASSILNDAPCDVLAVRVRA